MVDSVDSVDNVDDYEDSMILPVSVVMMIRSVRAECWQIIHIFCHYNLINLTPPPSLFRQSQVETLY